MNVKNIIKVVALAMLMPAMLLNSACSNEDEPIFDNENAPSRGYPLYVTVNVTRQGDAGTNRATYNDNGDRTGSLAFSTGDQLFVGGCHASAGYFDGTLTWTSGGTFSGTIYTQNEYTGTAEAIFTSNEYITATLLPAGYEDYGYLSIEHNHSGGYGFEDCAIPNETYTCATSKAAGVEQFSWEKTTEYDNGFALAPQNAILNFTITGLAASTNVAVSLTGSGYTITKTVKTNASGNATFAAGVSKHKDLNDFSLTVAGNPITIVSSEKVVEAGKIYNINRAVTPPTLAQTLNTAGMTVKVKYYYENDENYCMFSSVGGGTYTFQSGDGWAGGDAGCAKALVFEGGKLVFKQNFWDTIDDRWSMFGFSVTFDMSNNTYSNWVGGSNNHNPSFISVEVNSVPIALTQIITVADLVKEQGQSWSVIISSNPGKIKEDAGYVVRVSDNAKLQRDNWGMWQDVMTDDYYQSGDAYKFEGD